MRDITYNTLKKKPQSFQGSHVGLFYHRCEELCQCMRKDSHKIRSESSYPSNNNLPKFRSHGKTRSTFHSTPSCINDCWNTIVPCLPRIPINRSWLTFYTVFREFRCIILRHDEVTNASFSTEMRTPVCVKVQTIQHNTQTKLIVSIQSFGSIQED